jgi:uncharacterized protein with FMN-binding domain
MATRAGLAAGSLVLAVALILGLKAPDDATIVGSGSGSGTGSSGGPTFGGPTSGGSTSGGSTSGGSSAPPAASTGTSGTGSSSGTQTVDGTLISTRYGPVQVEITVSNGKITAITAIALPSGGRSGAISAYAAPILTSEALAAQSAQIDLVSGATYTSTAYERSLQAALDQISA